MNCDLYYLPIEAEISLGTQNRRKFLYSLFDNDFIATQIKEYFALIARAK